MLEYKYVFLIIGFVLLIIIWYRSERKKAKIRSGINEEVKRQGVITESFLKDSFSDEYAFEYVKEEIKKERLSRIDVDAYERLYYSTDDFNKKKQQLLQEKIIDIAVLTRYWKLHRLKYYSCLMERCAEQSEGMIKRISDESETIFYIRDKGLNEVRKHFDNKLVVVAEDVKKIIGNQPTGILINVVGEALEDKYNDWVLCFKTGCQRMWLKGEVIRRIKKNGNKIIDKNVVASVVPGLSDCIYEQIMERAINVLKQFWGDVYETVKYNGDDNIYVSESVCAEIRNVAKKEIVTEKELGDIIEDARYTYVVVNCLKKRYEELRRLVYDEGNHLWVNDKYINKYKCKTCGKISLKLIAYGPFNYCNKCLNMIHRKEDEDEKNGKTVKRYIDAPPPGVKIRM